MNPDLYANISCMTSYSKEYHSEVRSFSLTIGLIHPTGAWVTPSGRFPTVEEARSHALAEGVPPDRICVITR